MHLRVKKLNLVIFNYASQAALSPSITTQAEGNYSERQKSDQNWTFEGIGYKCW